jgi:hypothetical protein
MKKMAFTTSDIARLCHHSRESVKRWLERREIKGFRVGTSGHWRVLPKDLASFLKSNDIPFPEPSEVGVDLEALSDAASLPTFCWEFYQDRMKDHTCPDRSCEDCLAFKVRSINCCTLRREVGNRGIYCGVPCEQCDYFHFQQKQTLPRI